MKNVHAFAALAALSLLASATGAAAQGMIPWPSTPKQTVQVSAPKAAPPTAPAVQARPTVAPKGAPAKAVPAKKRVQAAPVRVLPKTTACAEGQPVFDWKSMGGDPYATSDAEAARKLPQALAEMVTLGCMPQAVADAFLKLVREDREWTPVILYPGHQFLVMQSRGGPILNVKIGLNMVGPRNSLVAAVKAKALAVQDSFGNQYYLYDPGICHNYALEVRKVTPPAPPPPPAAPPPPPPRAPEPCVVVNVYVNGRDNPATPYREGDGFVHAGFKALDACSAWRAPGETAWRNLQDCREEACIDRDFPLMFRLPVGEAQVGWMQIRVSRTAVTKYCLELKAGDMSDGVLVRPDDFHRNTYGQDAASIYPSERALPDDWNVSYRRLFFRYGQPQR